MKKFIIILFALAFAGETSRAQEWVQTNGPGGDGISSVLLNKNKDIFVLSQFGLVRTTDNGISWNALHPPQVDQYTNIAIAPNDNIYISSTRGVYKSLNNGDSWDSIASPCYDLKIAPDGTIYLEGIDRKGVLSFFRSFDEARSWDTVSLGAQIGMNFTPAIDSNGNIFIGGHGCIFRSMDQGKSWLRDTNGLGGLQVGTITFGRKGYIYMKAEDQNTNPFCLRSSDEGKNWTILNWTILPLNGGDFIFASSPSGRLFCTGINDNGLHLLRYSDNDGETWKDYVGLDKSIQSYLDGPIWADKDSGFYVEFDGTLYFTNYLGSWSQVILPLSHINSVAIMPDNSLLASSENLNKMLIGAHGLLSTSSDGGKTWVSLIRNAAFPYSGLIVIDSNKDIFTLNSNGAFLYRSTDNAITWRSVYSYVNVGMLLACVVHPNGNIFLVTRDSDLFRYDGLIWSHVDSLPMSRFNAISVDGSGNLYVSTASGNYISRNNGLNWFLDMSHPQATIFLTSNLYGDLYASNQSPSEMQISFDKGNTWSSFNKGLNATLLHGIITAPDGTVFAYTDSGIFKHVFVDCYWTPFSDGLSTTDILSMTFNKEGRLYAGSAGGGVFKSTQTFNKPPVLTGRLLATDIDFGIVNLGDTFCKNLTITNIGLKPITLNKNFIVQDPTPFSVASTNLFPIILQPRDSVTISICFHPPQVANYASEIDWETDVDASPCTLVKPQSLLHGIAVQKSDVKNIPLKINFSIRPNPVSGNSIWVTFPDAAGKGMTLAIYDVLGREIYKAEVAEGAEEIEASVVHLSEGIYYARVASGNTVVTERFVKTSEP